jgi:hypothetical protein
MTENDNKMMLAEENVAEVQKALEASQEEFLTPEKQGNVVGLGVGVKWSNGEPTGEPALLALVTQKMEKELLSKADLVPNKLEGMQTDVLSVGVLSADSRPPAHQTLDEKLRPAEGGYSVGHVKITAGTYGTAVYRILRGGSVNPPRHGLGIPRNWFILSNNHVLANSNNANVGDLILQPGPFDGGTDPEDAIARLSAFVPITFFPPVPLPLHKNLVDAAIAAGEDHDLDREIYWIGYLRGWRRRANVQVGTPVQKTGRTTSFTTGRITAINAIVDVNYSGGRVARFRDQIITTNMSAPGDSGSVVTTLDNVAVGLLFAGSNVATIANQIEHVRRLLGVEVAEQIL